MKDYRFVTDLTDKQLHELKIRYLEDHIWDTENRYASDYEINNVENIISDSLIFEQYKNYTFHKEDFDYGN